jgi:type VI secretion system protein ImpF
MNPAPSASRAAGRGSLGFAEQPLLDKLIDAEPERARDRPITATESLAQLRRAVHRDVEALLNARRPWRSLPPGMAALRLSPLGYGIADFTAGAFNERQQREALRSEIEETIRRFEPRLSAVHAALVDDGNALRTSLRLRIEGLLCAQPAPEPIAFDAAVDITTADVTVHPPRAP